MEKRPQFSILIPTTGRPSLVREAVKSVLDQTHRDFEIVVTDTSTSEESKRAATDSGDKRIVYAHTPDADPSLGWDHAAKIARGEYMLWLDDDNYLLPFALETLRNAIARTNAEIITASHLYYYDRCYPRHFLRNNLGVIPFTGREYALDLREALKSIYELSRRGAGLNMPRLHPAATAVSRRVIEQAFNRLGFVVCPRMRTNHSIHPIIFALAKSGLFIDRPVSIVGRYGVSITQTWSTSARHRLKRVPFDPAFSPVKGDTRTNNMVEGYLRVKNLLPELLNYCDINYERFAGIYMRELFFLDAGAASTFKNWINLFGFLKTLPSESRRHLWPRAIKLSLLVPAIFIARRMGLQYLWRPVQADITRRRYENARAKNPAGRKNKEYEIPLTGYNIESISSLALRIREIILKETGRDILFS